MEFDFWDGAPGAMVMWKYTPVMVIVNVVSFLFHRILKPSGLCYVVFRTLAAATNFQRAD